MKAVQNQACKFEKFLSNLLNWLAVFSMGTVPLFQSWFKVGLLTCCDCVLLNLKHCHVHSRECFPFVDSVHVQSRGL